MTGQNTADHFAGHQNPYKASQVKLAWIIRGALVLCLGAFGLWAFTVQGWGGVVFSLIGITMTILFDFSSRLPIEPNHSIADARLQIAKLFQNSEERICVLSKRLNPDVFETPAFKETVKQASGRKVQVRILITHPDTQDKARLLTDDHWSHLPGITIRCAPENARKRAHMVVVDGRHLRIEKPHPKDTDARVATCYYECPSAALLAEDDFNTFWSQSIPLAENVLISTS